MEPNIHDFKPPSELHPFEDIFFLITLVGLEAHATFCNVGGGEKDKCAKLFPKYWTKSHFLIENLIYIYMK